MAKQDFIVDGERVCPHRVSEVGCWWVRSGNPHTAAGYGCICLVPPSCGLPRPPSRRRAPRCLSAPFPLDRRLHSRMDLPLGRRPDSGARTGRRSDAPLSSPAFHRAHTASAAR